MRLRSRSPRPGSRSTACPRPLPPGDPRSRLLAADVLRVASIGLRTRRLRAALSAIGVAIGIAAMVAVLGISESSRANLLAELNTLGTNLLTVQPGQTFFGEDATLPASAGPAVRNLRSVRTAAAVTTISSASVRRNPYIEAAETSGITVEAAEPGLLATLEGKVTRVASWTPRTNATRSSCSAPWPPSASVSTA